MFIFALKVYFSFLIYVHFVFPIIIANFTFNNTATSYINGETFIGASSYVADRNANSNSALSRSTGIAFTGINNIPIGGVARSISIWLLVNVSVGEIVPLEYGDGSTNSRFLISYSNFPTNNFAFGAPPFYQTTNYTITNGVWYHYVVTTNISGTVKQYVNGVLIGTYAGTINTSSTNTCFMQGGYNGAVDDLKIYNREISATEVVSLFNNNTTLSSQNFNQNNLEVALYPNPVNDVLNIETALELQSVEIYNIQGQKVLSYNQKQINVSNLAAGMYMVRIQDSDNNIATKKIVIK